MWGAGLLEDKATIWPQLYAMAKDVLAVPAILVGVERLFNMAWDVCHYHCNHLKAETISSLMMMRHKDARKLEAKVENDDAADCDQFDNHQTKSDITWAWKQNFISSNDDSGEGNSYNELESFDRERPSKNQDLPNITQQSRKDRTLEVHIMYQQEASQMPISGQKQFRKSNDFLNCVGKRRAMNSQKNWIPSNLYYHLSNNVYMQFKLLLVSILLVVLKYTL